MTFLVLGRDCGENSAGINSFQPLSDLALSSTCLDVIRYDEAHQWSSYPNWSKALKTDAFGPKNQSASRINFFLNLAWLGRELSVFHFSSAFNSSPVLPPCLRRRLAVSVRSLLMAKSSGILPFHFAFTSAPLEISSSAVPLWPVITATDKGVHPSLFFVFTLATASKCCLTAAILPYIEARRSCISFTSCDSPHPTSTTAAIVVSRRCFISIHQPFWYIFEEEFGDV